jgi:hypothetical protein
MKAALFLVLLVGAISRVLAGTSVEVRLSSAEVTEISITVDNVEYIADAATPDKLKCVRVWRKPDFLRYNLYADRVDYTGVYTDQNKEMSQTEVATTWAKYVKKFTLLTKDLKVSVRK